MPYKPRSFDQQRTTVAASVTRLEADHLRAIANAQAISMNRLVQKALELAYGTSAKPKASDSGT